MSAIAPSVEISPYDRLHWPDERLLHDLGTPDHRRELALYLGAELHAQSIELTRQAALSRGRQRGTVWLIPGIMGSSLGLRRPAGEPPDVIWLDPIDALRGDIVKLQLTAESPVEALGLVHASYLRLWLRLLAAGYETQPFPYDWRRDVRDSGARLAAQLRSRHGPHIIVAHSLGGLVARAALTDPAASASVQRVVQIGTPNKGAAAARLALNGCYAVVRRIAMLDRLHDATQLSGDVFATFDSVRQLLPEHAWPGAALAPIDSRYRLIVGHGQITCIGAEHTSRGWRYHYSRAGDGTVAFGSARASDAPCYVAQMEHSALARDNTVAAAVLDLIDTGTTARLPGLASGQTPDEPPGKVHSLDHAQLAGPDPKIDWAAWQPEQRRRFLENLNEPLPSPLLAAL
jgi:hypothetical protein